MGYKFYYIKTYHTLEWIEEQLYRVGYATNQTLLRVIRNRTGAETAGTVAFLDEQVYFLLLQEARSDLKIEPFEVPRVFHPNPDKYTYNYCIPFPEGVPWAPDKFYIHQVQLLLSPFIAHGLVPPDAYQVYVPVVSRTHNQTMNVAFVSFHASIDRDTLAVMRYLLDGARWPYLPGHTFKCLWARIRR
jgi:hypothetical protein